MLISEISCVADHAKLPNLVIVAVLCFIYLEKNESLCFINGALRKCIIPLHKTYCWLPSILQNIYINGRVTSPRMLWSKSVALFHAKNRKQQIKENQDKRKCIQWTWMQWSRWPIEFVNTFTLWYQRVRNAFMMLACLWAVLYVYMHPW